jgi:hypothetical protein
MKLCVRCNKSKSFDKFYVRSGINNPTEPGHYNSECKECLKERSRITGHRVRTEPVVEAERMAIEYLTRHGIAALPGKAVAAVDVDVVCWGHVWIEVKYSGMKHRGRQEQFVFTATPKQRTHGFRAHLVMLICEWPDNRHSYHLFDAHDPVFYMGDRVKSGFTYTPGNTEAKKHGDNRVVMVDPLMIRACDRVGLIWAKMKEISEELKGRK